MILITSGSYLSPEFTSELGLLPPCFLPVGNQRLYKLQAKELTCFDEPVIMSLPDSFVISEHDQYSLAALDIKLTRVPLGLTLAESILHSLCTCPVSSEGIRILHGDTLIYDLPKETDVFTVGNTSAYYSWAVPSIDSEGKVLIREGLSRIGQCREVLSGYFAFSDRVELERSLALSRGIFIDALNIYASQVGLTPSNAGHWFDFGHLHTFHQSKAHITTQREFNTLEVGTATVVKTSSNLSKMEAEAQWFESLPPTMKINSPRFIRRTNSGYELEYLYLCTLSELMVFGELPEFVWMQILDACFRFLERCKKVRAPIQARRSSRGMYLPKTIARLEVFSKVSGISLDQPWTINGVQLPGLIQVAQQAQALIPELATSELCLVHGDFCFSNILYDFRRQDILVIDPRGQDAEGRLSVFGDIRYDVAKLYHSAAACYDFVKADCFTVSRTGPCCMDVTMSVPKRLHDVHYAFLSRVLGPSGISLETIKAINVQLFLSMLPLHADNPDHQMALLSIGMLMYASMAGLIEGAPAECRIAA